MLKNTIFILDRDNEDSIVKRYKEYRKIMLDEELISASKGISTP